MNLRGIENIGFFHFGAYYACPLTALLQSIMAASIKPNTLVVLPEAFNIAIPYRGGGRPNFSSGVIEDLKKLASCFNAIFVAGLTIEGNGPNMAPYSTAYCITGDCAYTMCYKVTRDDRAGTNYTAYEDIGSADPNNPICCGGIRVGALICADANPPLLDSQVLCPRIRSVVDSSDIICVPAHMGRGNFGDARVGHNAGLQPGWHNKRLILANSKADGIDSFLTDWQGLIVGPTVGGERNIIVSVPYA